MLAIDLPHARRLAFGVVLGQVTVTALAALLSWIMADSRAALSAGLGGGVSTAATLAFVLVGFRRSAASNPLRMLVAFVAGEAMKVVVVVVLLVLVLRSIRIAPLPMFGAYAATFLVYWVVLAFGLPARGAMHQPTTEQG